ncbi:MAG: WecB/TagA/CpsF family glycosyltransferase [Bacteroidales bacterium]|nr:WecB/TagA/CpsF family glycosyltransferase [Bacteroidales bacterium]
MQKYFNYCLTVNINDVVIPDACSQPMVVNCLNPHSFINALDDNDFKKALEQSDYLLPDGEGICITLKKWRKIKIDKIAGDDIHRHLLSQLSAKGGKVYYMGSSPQVLQLIANKLHKEFPTITARTHSPSFCDKLSKDESLSIVTDINNFAPDVLFVSMTAPKQEKWVKQYKSLLTNVKIIASIGAVFEFYAGTVKRAPAWTVKLKLEWLVRLLKEPRRMWSRNFVSTPRFLRWVKKNHCDM